MSANKKKDVSSIIENQQVSNFEKEFILVMNNARFRKVFNFLRKQEKRGKLLDIGCGTGDFAASLKKLGYDAHGLELEKNAVKLANQKGVITTQGSFVTGLPYKDKEFDVLFAGEVIEHTIDDDLFLRECYRILKPNGMLILTTPNLVSFGNRLLMGLGFLPRFAYQEFHYRIYNLSLLRKKLSNAKFSIMKVSAGHVLISRYFNKFFGFFGELAADIVPVFGEQFIIYAIKESGKKQK